MANLMLTEGKDRLPGEEQGIPKHTVPAEMSTTIVHDSMKKRLFQPDKSPIIFNKAQLKAEIEKTLEMVALGVENP